MVQRQNFTDVLQFLHYLEMGEELRNKVLVAPRFGLNVPLRLARKMAKNCLDDPLVRQFLPLQEERQEVEGFSLDAVGDVPARQAKKLLHKYEGRALVLASSACAMHCRFCFRQNFPYERGESDFEGELSYLEKNSSIHEVILSGGDPLSLSDEKLGALFKRLEAISHVKRVRFHSRFPIGIPERICESFLAILSSTRLQGVFVVHCNHPRELDPEVIAALKAIQKVGVPVLNQAVLLKGINDSPEVLHALCSTLVDAGILPYYLHQLDRVVGTAHFEVDKERGRALVQKLSSSLSGYAVPKYVQEVTGEQQKIPL